MRLDDCVHALAGHSQHLRDLAHAHEVVHGANLLLTSDNPAAIAADRQ